MRTTPTQSGTVCVGDAGELFAELARLGIEAWRASEGRPFSWALTGGSTPKAWYRWCVGARALPPDLLAGGHWFVGDERCVPPESDESNYGNASRFLLDPLGVAGQLRHPWRVDLPPAEAVARLAKEAEEVCGAGRGFSFCVLGLGDDAHTASLFPGSPLLWGGADGPRWAAVEVPGRGWRLTLTPAGLAACDRLVVHATGRAKAEAVRRVFAGNEPIRAVPAKLLGSLRSQPTWLLDTEAVSGCPDLALR